MQTHDNGDDQPCLDDGKNEEHGKNRQRYGLMFPLSCHQRSDDGERVRLHQLLARQCEKPAGCGSTTDVEAARSGEMDQRADR